MDNIFFCISRNEKQGIEYYAGYYKRKSDSTMHYPAVTQNLSEALKLTFRDEATRIIKALGRGWKVAEQNIKTF